MLFPRIFVIVVFAISLPFFGLGQNQYCKQIKKEADKFSGETKYRTPYGKPIRFIKIENESEGSRIYMSLQAYGATRSTNLGVIILLENGEKIELPNQKTDAKYNGASSGGGYTISSFIKLDQELIEKLSSSPITDFRLYIHDKKIKKGDKYMYYLQCLAPGDKK